MNIPGDRSYTVEHEWAVLTAQGTVRVGITDFAQDALGDVVFAELPDVGREVSAGEVVAEVESTKSVADIYTPISGQIAATNAMLVQSPELINSDPYGEGWIFELQPGEAEWQAGLLDADAYRTLTE